MCSFSCRNLRRPDKPILLLRRPGEKRSEAEAAANSQAPAAIQIPVATDSMTQEEAEDAFLKSLDYDEADYPPPAWSEYDSWGWDRRKKRGGLGSME